MAMDKARYAAISRRQLIGLTSALVVEFILGAWLTTIINYHPGKHSALQEWVLGLHILVGAGILIASIARLIVSVLGRRLLWTSSLGLVFVLVAFTSGMEAARTASNVAVFVMALAFISALITYAVSLWLAGKR